jgi:hypothetical protein
MAMNTLNFKPEIYKWSFYKGAVSARVQHCATYLAQTARNCRLRGRRRQATLLVKYLLLLRLFGGATLDALPE